jgi:hypothetical protein
MDTFTNCMMRAARLDASLYEEVEADPAAMRPAMQVVVLSSVAAGVGSITEGGLVGIIAITVGTLIGWYIWAGLTYLIGTRLLAEPQTHVDMGQLLRTTGFSSSPGVIRLLGIVPGLANIVMPIAAVWMLVTMIVAVRQALDYSSTWRAVVVCLIGWVVQVLVLVGLLLALAPNAVPPA